MTMAMHLDEKRLRRQRQIEQFAMEAASGLSGDGAFPEALWRKMGEAGLLGLGLPSDYGGSGGDWLTIQAAGEAFAGRTGSLGMTLSWIIHLMVCRFAVLGFGTDGQIRRWIPRLARGEITPSLAISEPGTGAHPRYLRTQAVRENGDWVLTGEKSFLTNGPLAGLFLVLAVTGMQGDRKQMTAFLVPRESPGLSLTDPLRLDFLRPSPHCGIRLEGCRVHSDQVLGGLGDAFERISKPFRDLEDAMLMGPIAGGMQVLTGALPVLIQNQRIGRTDDLTAALGELQCRLDALRILAYEAAAMLDSGRRHPEFPSLLLSFRFQAGQFQARLAEVLLRWEIQTDRTWAVLAKDLAVAAGIAEKIAHIKQRGIGEAMFPKKGSQG